MKSTQLALAAVFFIAFGITACDEGNDPTSNVPPTRTVTVNITGTGAEGVTHNAPAAILQSTTQLAVALSDVPANATVTATNGAVAGNEVTFAFAAGASALSFAITVTAATVGTPTVTLTPTSVTINDGNLTASVNVTGTATGAVTLNTATLPTGVTATVSGTAITVTGVRQASAVNDTFIVGVTRQGITQNLSVAVNLTADVTAPTVILSSNSVAINDGNLTASVNVTGTATGAISLNTATLPAGVTASVSGTTITVTGVRQATAINDTFIVGVTRQGITQNLSVAVDLTADVTAPTVILSSNSVTINDGNLTASVNVTGTATGVISLDTATLPTGVTATVSGTAITVTGVRQTTAVSGNFTVGVTRQGITQNLSVAVDLAAAVAGLPTTPGLFLGAPETLTSASTPIAAVDANLAAAFARLNLAGAANDGEYTLLLNGDVTITSQRALNVANRQLTIIGLGGERTITANLPHPFELASFTISAANARLALGNNIAVTRTGLSNHVVVVDNATAGFTMLEGSALSGSVLAFHNIVLVNNGSFTMYGGSIAGNTMHGNNVGIVSVSAGGTFTMNAGEITGNTNTDVTAGGNGVGGVWVGPNGTFTMNGGRVVGNTGQVGDVRIAATATFNNAGNFPTGTPATPITVNPGQSGIGALTNLSLPVMLSHNSVTIDEGNFTANVTVAGTATGAVTLDTSALPTGVTATVSGTTITVAGFRQPTAINGTFTIGVTRGGVTQNLSVVVNLSAITVILSSNSVPINDGNLTSSVNITGTATGGISLNTATLPTGVNATVSGTTITVTGVRQTTAVSGTFTVGVTRQGVTQNLSVVVNLTAVAAELPTTPGLFLGAPETLTPASTPIAAVNDNLAAAITRLNLAGAANDGAYTLLLNSDVTVTAPRTLNVANRQLTIIGLGGERTIQYAGAAGNQAFVINAANARLTLGNNVTLRGISGSSAVLVNVQNGNFFMQSGSRITGHTTSSGNGAVQVLGANAFFTMEGGEIIGNVSTATAAAANGGVRVMTGGNFTMTGGRIYGNFRNTNIPADVTVISNAGSSNTGGVPTGTPEAPITVNLGQPGIGVLNDSLNP